MAGYWRAPEATAERFWQQTLRTGDHGYLDGEGEDRLFYVGRYDDIFKRKSARMSVQEIKAAALDVPGVPTNAAVRPEQDGELVVWVVGEVTPRQVLAGIATRLDRAKVPDRCVVVSDLPATVNGKVDTHALRQGRRS